MERLRWAAYFVGPAIFVIGLTVDRYRAARAARKAWQRRRELFGDEVGPRK